MEQCSTFPIKMCAKTKGKNQHIYFIFNVLLSTHLDKHSTQQYQSTKEPLASHLLPHSRPLWSLATAHLCFPSVVSSFLEYRTNVVSLRWSLHLA